MKMRSIHFRLTAWYAVVLAAALGLFGVLIQVSLRQRLVSDLDQEVADSAGRFEIYFQHEAAQESGGHLKGELDEFCQALPAANYVALKGSRGLEFRYPERGTVDGSFRVSRRRFLLDGEEFSLEAGASTRGLERTLELLRLLLLSLIPAVIAIACVGGAWLSRRALKPVDEITLAARTIEIDHLSQRLPVRETGDELQRLTEVWNSMLARLEAAVKTLSQFAADASHELRTPLAVIRTSAELALRRARTTESYRESLQEISVEAERMTQLVEDLLFLARSASSSIAFRAEPIELRTLLDGVSEELRDLAKLRHIELRTNYPAEEIAVPGSSAALRRLFLVLIDNALKYSQGGSAVDVVIAADQSRVTVTIEDRGIGIAPEDLPHIFQRFYRADKARSDGGYGLGLSIASTIAQAHGAVLSAKSVEGEGSVFSVVFRRAALEAGMGLGEKAESSIPI
jgi:two-component system heavy metal sensor histidine kinase CusS